MEAAPPGQDLPAKTLAAPRGHFRNPLPPGLKFNTHASGDMMVTVGTFRTLGILQ